MRARRIPNQYSCTGNKARPNGWGTPGTKKGPALGLFAEGKFPTHRCPMKVGDLIALFTNGLIEAEGADNESLARAPAGGGPRARQTADERACSRDCLTKSNGSQPVLNSRTSLHRGRGGQTAGNEATQLNGLIQPAGWHERFTESFRVATLPGIKPGYHRERVVS